MLEFRDIDISDMERAERALRSSDNRGAEYCFSNNMAWRRLNDSKIAFLDDFYFVCAFDTDDGIPQYLYPAGSGDLHRAFDELKKHAEGLGKTLRITGVTDDKLRFFEGNYSGQYECTPDRDSTDYVYESGDLIGLPGKKYHAKRNHLARFMDIPHTFSMMTDNDFDDCITFMTKEYNERSHDADHSMIAEQFAINTFFTYFHEFGLQGGIIRIDGNIAAVTLGERLCSDTYLIHIEKADTSYPGIYAGINKLFASEAAANYRYINREEDLGLEGLRRSKMSYHPAFLLDKYTITFK